MVSDHDSTVPRGPAVGPTDFRGNLGNARQSGRWWLPVFLALFVCPAAAPAQQSILGGREPGGQYPSPAYYLALEVYRSGELEQAVDAFDQAMRSTRRDINGQWIDAIPVYAMQAECHWHLGNLEACRANLDQALALAVQHRGWLSQVDWTSATRGNVQLAPERGAWPAAASMPRIPISDRMSLHSGTLLTEQRLVQGGAIEEPNIRVIDVAEVMRGVATASYRRRVLLGPLAEQDPLAGGLLEATRYPAGLQLPLARGLIGAMRAVGRFGSYEDERVPEEVSQTATLGGAIHPLSPVALLASASALAGSENPGQAVAVAMQAANAAAAWGQPEWVGEALQLAAGCSGPGQAASVRQLAELASAASARTRGSRLAAVHASIAAADAAATTGQLADASQFLAAAQAVTARRRVGQPRLEAYWGWVSARVAAQRGESGGGGGIESGLAIISRFALQRRFGSRPLVSMPGIYQMALLRGGGDALGGKRAEELLGRYLNDPPAEVWRRDPVDAIALTIADRSAVEEAWLAQAMVRTDGAEFLRRVNHVRGSRFLRQLPLAGRLTQLRRLASAEVDDLPEAARDLVANPPQRFANFRAAVIAPEPAEIQERLAKADGLESVAWQLALDRVAVPRTMPPPLVGKDVAGSMPPRTALITFHFAGNRLFGLLSAEGQTEMWEVGGSGRLPRDVGDLLRTLGIGKTRGNRLPENGDWRKAAAQLRTRLVPDESVFAGDRFDDLVIVPDGLLWYLPLEVLPAAEPAGPLIGETLRVRYAATPSLAVTPVAPQTGKETIGFVSRALFAPRDRDADDAAIEATVEGMDHVVRLPGQVTVPSRLLGGVVGHLVVAAPQSSAPEQPLALPVAAYDANSPGGTLEAWMRLPVAAPRTVVLAGFRTPIDLGKLGTGQELFVTICGLQVSGVRDILISRWAVGGRSSAHLLRELMQELPYTGIVDAWHRARQVTGQVEIDPAGEPLLARGDQKRQGVTGKEPLFWAGYLLASPLDGDEDSADPEGRPGRDAPPRPGGLARPEQAAMVPPGDGLPAGDLAEIPLPLDPAAPDEEDAEEDAGDDALDDAGTLREPGGGVDDAAVGFPPAAAPDRAERRRPLKASGLELDRP